MKLGIYAVVVAAIAMSCQKKSSGSDDVAPQVENAPSGEQEKTPAGQSPAPEVSGPEVSGPEVPGPESLTVEQQFIANNYGAQDKATQAVLLDELIAYMNAYPGQSPAVFKSQLDKTLKIAIGRQQIAAIIESRFADRTAAQKTELLVDFEAWAIERGTLAYTAEMFDVYLYEHCED